MSACSTQTAVPFSEDKAIQTEESKIVVRQNALLDFSAYYLTECNAPEQLTNDGAKDVLKLIAESDMLHADCIKRHNGLIKEIWKRKSLIKK